MKQHAFIGASIFDGHALTTQHALLLEDGKYMGQTEIEEIPEDYEIKEVNGGVFMPGFVDLQVNGGGGVLFNDETTPAGLDTIARAHASCGTHAILPTLITDTPQKTAKAIQATIEAIENGVKGIVGLHLEGPHLSIARKGAHDPALIRPMEAQDEAMLLEAIERLPNVMLTVAPENVSNAQIKRLSDAGAIVSLGHTDCSFEEANLAFEAGARCVTHLFNAMSQMQNRAPGLVGATLSAQNVSAGLIADNLHVHAGAMQTAMAATRGRDAIFLVSDAMSTVGSDIREFFLNGRRVLRQQNRLTLEDGTLAGADLDLPTAIAVLQAHANVDAKQAYQMASSIPAGMLRNPFGLGQFEIDKNCHGIYLDHTGKYQCDIEEIDAK